MKLEEVTTANIVLVTHDHFDHVGNAVDIVTKTGVSMHYKTFPILEQSADRFVELARKQAPEVEVIVLEPGQEYALQSATDNDGLIKP